jgi:hypothetical protein
MDKAAFESAEFGKPKRRLAESCVLTSFPLDVRVQRMAGRSFVLSICCRRFHVPDRERTLRA